MYLQEMQARWILVGLLIRSIIKSIYPIIIKKKTKACTHHRTPIRRTRLHRTRRARGRATVLNWQDASNIVTEKAASTRQWRHSHKHTPWVFPCLTALCSPESTLASYGLCKKRRRTWMTRVTRPLSRACSTSHTC
jgi:hypothetical protein